MDFGVNNDREMLQRYAREKHPELVARLVAA